VLTAVAGNTTAANKATNGPGNPTRKYAEDKNTIPETMVPMAVKTPIAKMERLNFLTTRNNPKRIKAVTNLSIIFGTNPPGNVEVIPDSKPVTIAKSSTLFLSGNKIIPKNIIVSIISGFIPKKMPGTTVCKTDPIPTSRERATRFFVFISQLSSSILSSLFFDPPSVHSLPDAKACGNYNMVFPIEKGNI
jgi:hypothetical protein